MANPITGRIVSIKDTKPEYKGWRYKTVELVDNSNRTSQMYMEISNKNPNLSPNVGDVVAGWPKTDYTTKEVVPNTFSLTTVYDFNTKQVISKADAGVIDIKHDYWPGAGNVGGKSNSSTSTSAPVSGGKAGKFIEYGRNGEIYFNGLTRNELLQRNAQLAVQGVTSNLVPLMNTLLNLGRESEFDHFANIIAEKALIMAGERRVAVNTTPEPEDSREATGYPSMEEDEDPFE